MNPRNIISAGVSRDLRRQLADQPGRVATWAGNGMSITARLTKRGGAVITTAIQERGVCGPFAVSRRLPVAFSDRRFINAVGRCLHETRQEAFRRGPIEDLAQRFDAANLHQMVLERIAADGEAAGHTSVYDEMRPEDVRHYLRVLRDHIENTLEDLKLTEELNHA